MNIDAASRLTQWLADHDGNLERFAQLVPISEVAAETNIDADAIRQAVFTSKPPIHHVWSHKYRGGARPNKPYCLRLGGPDALCLDWEDSVVAAAEADFQRRGYFTCRELGTDEHVQCLIRDPDLRRMTPGLNLRDLWVQRREGNHIDCWIIEAKGKEAGGFDRYCLAEALSQLFKIPAEPLMALLGTRRGPGHGLCSKFADQLLNAWRGQGWTATITLAVLIPLWEDDVVWDASTPRPRSYGYYKRPVEELMRFIEHGSSSLASVKKGEAAFRNILDGLDSDYGIRSLALSATDLCFRILTTSAEREGAQFTLRQFPMIP